MSKQAGDRAAEDHRPNTTASKHGDLKEEDACTAVVPLGASSLYSGERTGAST